MAVPSRCFLSIALHFLHRDALPSERRFSNANSSNGFSAPQKVHFLIMLASIVPMHNPTLKRDAPKAARPLP